MRKTFNRSLNVPHSQGNKVTKNLTLSFIIHPLHQFDSKTKNLSLFFRYLSSSLSETTRVNEKRNAERLFLPRRQSSHVSLSKSSPCVIFSSKNNSAPKSSNNNLHCFHQSFSVCHLKRFSQKSECWDMQEKVIFLLVSIGL